jgi:hypothetical protein
MGFHLFPSQGSRRIRLVSGNATAQLRLHFLLWLRSPTLLHNLIPQAKYQFQPILERPAADSVQGGQGFHKENCNRGDAVSLPRMVRLDKSPDADQVADAEATENKQSGRGSSPSALFCFVRQPESRRCFRLPGVAEYRCISWPARRKPRGIDNTAVHRLDTAVPQTNKYDAYMARLNHWNGAEAPRAVGGLFGGATITLGATKSGLFTPAPKQPEQLPL